MKTKVFTTNGGKEITSFIDPGTSQYRIKFLSGGELPVELTGIFTSANFAERAIESYLLKTTNIDKEIKKKDITKEA